MSQAAHGEKSGVCKARECDISKPALLCRDYPPARIESMSLALVAKPTWKLVNKTGKEDG